MRLRQTLMMMTAAGVLAIAGQAIAAAAGAPPTANAPTPRLANGKPDLTGNWQRVGPGGAARAFQNRDTPDATGGQANIAQVREGNYNYEEVDAEFIVKANQDMPHYRAEHWEEVRRLEENAYRRPADPQYGCKNQGVVRLYIPAEILAQPHKITMLYVPGMAIPWFREVPMDRKLPTPEEYEGLRPTGVSSARWDGDTLVIETVDFPGDGQVWYGTRGWFASPEAKVTERFKREGDRITYDMTVEDPNFTRPWVRPTETLALNRGAILQEPLTCIEKDGDYLPPSQ